MISDIQSSTVCICTTTVALKIHLYENRLEKSGRKCVHEQTLDRFIYSQDDKSWQQITSIVLILSLKQYRLSQITNGCLESFWFYIIIIRKTNIRTKRINFNNIMRLLQSLFVPHPPARHVTWGMHVTNSYSSKLSKTILPLNLFYNVWKKKTLELQREGLKIWFE